jgi:hypothetical protein
MVREEVVKGIKAQVQKGLFIQNFKNWIVFFFLGG